MTQLELQNSSSESPEGISAGNKYLIFSGKITAKFFFIALLVTMIFTVNSPRCKALTYTWSNGVANHKVVRPASPNDVEAAAIADLEDYLEEMTGADFTDPGATYNIYIGVAPPGAAPLQERERRIKSVIYDVYIYGEGEFGTAFAIYDYLEKYWHCRWYSVTDTKIPTYTSPRVTGALDYSLVPSFRYISLYGGNWFSNRSKKVLDFCRRSRNHLLGTAYNSIGPGGPHTPFDIIDPDVYFSSHPEYFSLNNEDVRVSDKQLCYSNEDLRELYIEKLEDIIDAANLGPNETARIWVDLEDNSGPWDMTCCCDDCRALATSYDSPAGAYYDFLFEVCDHFETYAPNVTIMGIAYWLTENPPSDTKLAQCKALYGWTESMPDNLSWGYSPLWSNYLKPYDHTSNSDTYDIMDEWTDKTSNVRLQIYPTVYPSWVISHPLTANVQRMVDNLRIAEGLGVAELFGQMGYFIYSTVGFNELRVFMILQMAQDVNRDEEDLIEEFMDHHYGAASSMMQDYYAELEACEAAETNVLRWSPQPEVTLSYLTESNLLDWEDDFDDMEALVAADARSLLNVKRVRVELDEAVISVYEKLTNPPNRTTLMARYQDTVEDDTDDLVGDSSNFENYEDWESAPNYLMDLWPKGINSMNAIIGNHTLGLDVSTIYNDTTYSDFDNFPAGSEIYSVIPHASGLLENNYVPLGFVIKTDDASEDIDIDRLVAIPQNSIYGGVVHILDQHTITNTQLINNMSSGSKNAYYLGRTRLWPDCFLVTSDPFTGSRIYLGKHYDSSRPNAEFRLYLFVKYYNNTSYPPPQYWMDRLVLVKMPTDLTSANPQPIGDLVVR